MTILCIFASFQPRLRSLVPYIYIVGLDYVYGQTQIVKEYDFKDGGLSVQSNFAQKNTQN